MARFSWNLLSRPAWAALCGVLLLGASRSAAQVSVHIELGQSDALVNEAVAFDVVAQNAAPDAVPAVPEIEGCLVRLAGGPFTSQQISIVGNRRVSRTTVKYRYELIARKPGVITIPAIEVIIGGKTYRTKPETLSVSKSSGDVLAVAELRSNAERVYVGQRVRYTLTVWIKPPRMSRSMGKDWVAQFIRSPQQRDGAFVFQRAGETRRSAGSGPEETFYYYEWDADVRPDSPGPPSFDQLDVIIDYPTRVTQNVFGDVVPTDARRLSVPIETRLPDVLPLPTEGRPERFYGAVGTFRIETSARPTQVRLGDPIELTITISGDGALETLPPPDLAGITALTEHFRVPDESLAGRMIGDRRVFSQTIRARTTEIAEIPPIELPYFDPKRGAYSVARSEAIPIRVSAGAQVSEVDVVGMQKSTSTADSAVSEAVDGLRGNIVDDDALLSHVASVTLTQVAAATVIPPACFAAFWVGLTLARTGTGAAARRRQGALAAAQRRIAAAGRLPAAECSREIAAALSGYIADRLNEPPARFGGRALAQYLASRGVDAELTKRCDAVMQECEQAAYAGGAATQVALIAAAGECLAGLERTGI